MPLTPSEAVEICRRLLLIPRYPAAHHDLVIEELMRFADDPAKLKWVVETAVPLMVEWGGVGVFRGLWCTRWKPADGMEMHCTLTGHTAAEIEQENNAPSKLLLEGAALKALPMPEAEIARNRAFKRRAEERIENAAEAKQMKPDEDYQPPEWLRQLAPGPVAVPRKKSA